MKVKSESEIKEFLTATANEVGVEIVDVEFKQGKNPALTIYVDKEGGIDLDTCEIFHRAIDAPLDSFDPTYGEPYTLNVSSPGVDRPFKTDKDFISHIGQMVEIKLKNSIKGKKMYDCTLLSYDGKSVTVKVDNQNTFTIDLKNLAKMNEYIDFK